MPTLIIFIDSLPHSKAAEFMENIDPSFYVSKVKSGAGFSNNIYAEIVTGLTPDEIGYFNEWEFDRSANLQKVWLKVLSKIDFLRQFIYLNAGLRRLVLNKLLGYNFFNIPFKYFHFFKPSGSHNFRDIKHGNILIENKFEIFDAAESQSGVGNRDGDVINKIKQHLPQGNVMLSLVDLDNIAHIFGLTSTHYTDHLNYLQNELRSIVKTYQHFSDQHQVIFFSDHGMVDVTRGVHFELESRFGNASYEGYCYFVDATYVRVWAQDVDLLEQIEGYLSSLDYGKIISKQERIEYGFESKEFGDLIFRANEGVMFAPNFFGARVCKSMHGYDPRLESQSAFFACCEFSWVRLSKMPTSTLCIHSALKQLL